MNIIQNIILPDLELQTPLNMYFRVNKTDFDHRDICETASEYDYGTKILTLSGGKKYFFNTFYNGLSVNIWKQNCCLETLRLKLRGRGRVQAELMLMQHEFDMSRNRKNTLVYRVLAQKTVNLSEEGVSWPVEAWPQLKDGMLYLTLRTAEESESQAEFYGGCFETANTAPHNVRLGIVVTHFNRKNYVLPAMRRLKRDILEHSYYSGYIDLAVIDNSRNITAAEADGITILPNANYGGAGGFARGLLHWQDKGFSHCLFMDDDASCEIESICRTLSLLQYAKDERLAVSGAMLRECEPYRLWSKGEYYKKFRFFSPGHNLDIRINSALLEAEKDSANMSKFGGFWHFAFPINGVSYYPFPFFVRGDDVQFGITNDFQIITLNGIGNFADDFGLKGSPFIAYLDMRCNLVIEAITGKSCLYRFIKKYKREVRRQLYVYNYAHARASSLAVNDFISGLDFWTKNIELAAIRQRLEEEAPGEVAYQHKRLAHGTICFPHKEGRLRKFIRKVTWQGFLLPSSMIRHSTALIAKNYAGHPTANFRREMVFYYVDNMAHGYYTHYDKSRFFTEWRLSWKIRIFMLFRLKSVITEYRKNWRSLASEKFWREIYNLPSPATNEPSLFPAANTEKQQ